MPTDELAVVDAYFDELEDAFAEARRRRAALGPQEALTKIERSRYGGYRVRTLPADFVLEGLLDSLPIINGRSSLPL